MDTTDSRALRLRVKNESKQKEREHVRRQAPRVSSKRSTNERPRFRPTPALPSGAHYALGVLGFPAAFD